MTLSIIAAIGKNNELGKGNMLLWDLPRDMKHFRETTSGKTVIMGQKTFESLGRPLPNRRNIILTKDVAFKSEGIEIVHSLDEAIELLRTSPQPSPYQGEGENTKDEEVFIIGGGQIYKLFIEKANKLYITHVDMETDADTYFPTIDKNIWTETKSSVFPKDDANKYNLEFVEYTRK